MYQVDTNVSRDLTTQQRANEVYAFCIYSVQLPPGPRAPKAKIPSTNNTVLPIN